MPETLTEWAASLPTAELCEKVNQIATFLRRTSERDPILIEEAVRRLAASADNTDSVKSPPGTESTDPDGDARSAAIALMHAAEANDCLLRDIWAGNGPPTLQAIFRGLSNKAAEYVAYLAYSDGTNDWRAKAGLTSASATPDTLNDVIAGATAMGLLNDDTAEPDPALDAEPEQIGPEWTFTPSDQSSFLTFLCEQPNGEACLVRLNGDVWESASATGEPNWIASPVADASESREGAAYAYFYYAHTIGGEFDDTPEPDQAPTATPMPDLDATVERAKREILADLGAERFAAADITTFADLHYHVDANEYGGICEADFPLTDNELTDFGNELQGALDDWIKAGGLVEDLSSANGRWLTAGELRRYLERFTDDMPLTVGRGEGGWLNVNGATNPYAEGEPSIILMTSDTFDTRQF